MFWCIIATLSLKWIIFCICFFIFPFPFYLFIWRGDCSGKKWVSSMWFMFMPASGFCKGFCSYLFILEICAHEAVFISFIFPPVALWKFFKLCTSCSKRRSSLMSIPTVSHVCSLSFIWLWHLVNVTELFRNIKFTKVKRWNKKCLCYLYRAMPWFK